MGLKEKVGGIGANLLPIILMIALIPFVENDYILTVIYVAIICLCFLIKYEKGEYLFFLFGFLIMIPSEAFFISTGVETFTRRSFFGLMPLWLPVLWAYAFVAMKRGIKILES